MWIPYDIRSSLKAESNPEAVRLSRADGRRRIYTIDPEPLRTIQAWIAYYRQFWESALDDLADEVERSKAERVQQGRPAS